MSFRHGLTYTLASLLTASALVGCSGSNEASSVSSSTSSASTLSVLCPAGAPALASLGLAENGAEIEYVEGQDLLVSELSKENSEYDMIIAPINVGVRTWKEAGNYELDGVLTWGNLYLVSELSDWNEPDQSIALFGEGAVPGLVFSNLYPEVKAQAEYYPSVAEASASLVSGKANTALLAQPAAAGAIAKVKENGTEFFVVEDLQETWQAVHQSDHKGYPQAALFVKKGKADEYSQAIASLKEWLAEADSSTIENAVDKYTADKLGVPNAKLAASTWSEQNIDFVEAKTAQKDIEDFLAIFNIELPEDIIVQSF